MPNEFDPQRQYDPMFDVRDWTTLLDRVRRLPSGVLWPILGARRAGKTWALRALEAQLEHPHFIDARQVPAIGDGLEIEPQTRVILFDELGPHLFVEPPPGEEFHRHRPREESIEGFVHWCRDQKRQNRVVIVALTPAEWHALQGHRSKWSPFIPSADLQVALTALRPAQARKLAGRTQRGEQVVEKLLAEEPDWCRNPFLLTLLLDIHCDTEPDVQAACTRACHRAHGDFQYGDRVVCEGLNASQRSALHQVRRHVAIKPEMRTLLTRAGQLCDDAGREFELCDPVVARYLPPPVRVHHISDLHFGAKTAYRVDAKYGGDVGGAMAQAVGQGPIRDDYLQELGSWPIPQRPHLLVVSGDLAEWGKDHEFNEARAWLERAQELLAPDHPELAPDAPRVLLVGGNHDVDWSLATGAGRERHLGLARAFEGKVAWIRPQLEHPPEDPRHSAHVRYPDAGLEFVLWGSAEHGGQIDEQLLKVTDALRVQAVAALDEGQQEVAEALGQRYSRIDPGLVHTRDLQRLRQDRPRDPIRIAVLHHPISAIPTSTEVSPFAALVNAGEVKDVLFEQRFTLVLHGHVHTAWIGTESWPGRHDGHTITIVSAATLGSHETYEQHGFNELRIMREGQRRWIEIDRFRRQGQGFDVDGATVEVTVASSILV